MCILEELSSVTELTHKQWEHAISFYLSSTSHRLVCFTTMTYSKVVRACKRDSEIPTSNPRKSEERISSVKVGGNLITVVAHAGEISDTFMIVQMQSMSVSASFVLFVICLFAFLHFWRKKVRFQQNKAVLEVDNNNNSIVKVLAIRSGLECLRRWVCLDRIKILVHMVIYIFWLWTEILFFMVVVQSKQWKQVWLDGFQSLVSEGSQPWLTSKIKVLQVWQVENQMCIIKCLFPLKLSNVYNYI